MGGCASQRQREYFPSPPLGLRMIFVSRAEMSCVRERETRFPYTRQSNEAHMTCIKYLDEDIRFATDHHPRPTTSALCVLDAIVCSLLLCVCVCVCVSECVCVCVSHRSFGSIEFKTKSNCERGGEEAWKVDQAVHTNELQRHTRRVNERETTKRDTERVREKRRWIPCGG